MLAIERRDDGVVAVAGRLDAAQSPSLQAALDAIQGPVTLDCSGLEYVSSAGLGVLLQTQKRLMASGGKVRLVGVSRHVRDILRYSGFDRIFGFDECHRPDAVAPASARSRRPSRRHLRQPRPRRSHARQRRPFCFGQFDRAGVAR